MNRLAWLYSKKNINNDTAGFNWVHDTFGTNLRMTEMQATIGICQLKKLNKTIETLQYQISFK